MDYASTLLQLLPSARRLPGLRELINSIEAYLPAEQVERVRGRGIRRRSARGPEAALGRALHHASARGRADPRRAAPRPDTLIAALLHDVIEDTPISKDELAGEVRRAGGRAGRRRHQARPDPVQVTRRGAQAESFRKMLLAMARDVRVILIKLADRLHNMRTLDAMAPAKRRAHRARDARDLRADRRTGSGSTT